MSHDAANARTAARQATEDTHTAPAGVGPAAAAHQRFAAALKTLESTLESRLRANAENADQSTAVAELQATIVEWQAHAREQETELTTLRAQNAALRAAAEEATAALDAAIADITALLKE